MNLPPQIRSQIKATVQTAAEVAAMAAAARANEFVSAAVGKNVAVSSGPVGQIVISPRSRVRNPALGAGEILLPVLIGSAALVAYREIRKHWLRYL